MLTREEFEKLLGALKDSKANVHVYFFYIRDNHGSVYCNSGFHIGSNTFNNGESNKRITGARSG